MTLEEKIAFLESRGFTVVEETFVDLEQYYTHTERRERVVWSVYKGDDCYNLLAPTRVGYSVVEYIFKLANMPSKL